MVSSSINHRSGFSRAWIVVLIFTVCLVALFAAMVMGRFYAGFKSPNQVIAVTSSICGSDKINQFNTAIGNGTTSNWKELEQGITSQASFANDPNCAFMVALYAMHAKDDAAATSAINDLQTLNRRGLNASGSINSLASISQLQSLQAAYRSYNATTPAAGAIQGEG